MRKSKTCKKVLALGLIFTLITGILPVTGIPDTVQAEETDCTVKTIAGLGTDVMANPAAPASSSSAWNGSYVYFGNYNADGDGITEATKYRVLDKNTTKFSADGITETMLLDCDSILYVQPFDENGYANADGGSVNDWSISDAKDSLNGSEYLNKSNCFTAIEKNAIAQSTIGTHPLVTYSYDENIAGVDSYTKKSFVNYVPLTGEKIFLLDAEDVSNVAYGYSKTAEAQTINRTKAGSKASFWWLRSASSENAAWYAGLINSDGYITSNYIHNTTYGVSPALNVDVSSVLFTSAITGTAGETGTEYKLTLKDSDMCVSVNDTITRTDNTITIPYSISGNNSENVTQLSILILDKEYTDGNTNNANVLCYEKLAVADLTTSTSGTFVLPEDLTDKICGLDYHMYILAENVNEDKETDYASEPLEIILDEEALDRVNEIDTVAIPNIESPVPEQPLPTEMTISSDGIAKNAALVWKKDAAEVTGNGEWKTNYQAYVTLTAAEGYIFTPNTNVLCDENAVDAKNILLNDDGTLTVALGEFQTAARKIKSVMAPEVPAQFANTYTIDTVLNASGTNSELSKTAALTLEGTTEPNVMNVAVTWSLANENAAGYNPAADAFNTFQWTIPPSTYTDYDISEVQNSLTGTAAIQNHSICSATSTTLGTDILANPSAPADTSEAWTGSYVYLGNYDADGDGLADAIKYRVLDKNTTRFSKDKTTQTLFLDCDSVLYNYPWLFDTDGIANAEGGKANDWSSSDLRNSLNGGEIAGENVNGFINDAFTKAERNAIAESTIESHALTIDSTDEGAVNVDNWTQSAFVNYVPLNGDKIFVLDAEDIYNTAYGYNTTAIYDSSSREKTHPAGTGGWWWLRSAIASNDTGGSCVMTQGGLDWTAVNTSGLGVSPALNVNLSSVIFTTAISGLAGETGTEYKLTLQDEDISIAANGNVTQTDNIITVPYRISGNNSANVTQISVLITDKIYTAGNTNGASILFYDKLYTEDLSADNCGTFVLPDDLTDKVCGQDYYLYILAEDINAEKETNYASAPMEIPEFFDEDTPTEIDIVTVPDVNTPVPEQSFITEMAISSHGVSQKATLTWKKNGIKVSGNADWKTTYQAFMTVTAEAGYTFADNIHVFCGEKLIDVENVTLNPDGSLTLSMGNHTTATRKITAVTAPDVSTCFENHYTKDTILSVANTELGKMAKLTLEGTSEVNSMDVYVEWIVIDENGQIVDYNATPAMSNIFMWAIPKNTYAEYDTEGLQEALTGTVCIQNADYIPVTITGEDKSITYSENMTIDLSAYFIIDSNAGTAAYELLDTSTGTGIIQEKNLILTTPGIFDIRVNTLNNGVYAEGTHTIRLTIKEVTSETQPESTPSDKTPDNVTQNNNTQNNNTQNSSTQSSTPDTGKDDISTNIKVSKIAITNKNVRIAAGKKAALTATVFPDTATDKTLTWTSSNPKWASVNADTGLVTTKKAGKGKTVTITAAAADGSGIKAAVKVKIMKNAVKKVTLKAAKKKITAGKKVKIKATIKTTGKKNVNKTLKWTTSNAKWATVKNGTVTTKKAGKGHKVKITATSTDGTNKKASVTISIK